MSRVEIDMDLNPGEASGPEDRGRSDDMIGNSVRMREVYRLVARVAPWMTTVLIRGETGTGKELVARAIHRKNSDGQRRFLAISCAALVESRAQHQAGVNEPDAFPNALVSGIGKFETAHSGTLFLDEIGELSRGAQARLLGAIQDKEFQHSGPGDPMAAGMRLIASTSHDLEKYVAEGRFREDLLYRINVFTIAIPPLRDRGADIILLANHFARKFSRLHRKNIERISRPALEMILAYAWPGNVRELENVVERAVLVSEKNVIERHDLPAALVKAVTGSKDPGPHGTFEYLVKSYEKELILEAVKDTHGNLKDAAQLLKTTQRVIQYKVHRYNIDYRKYRGMQDRGDPTRSLRTANASREPASGVSFHFHSNEVP